MLEADTILDAVDSVGRSYHHLLLLVGQQPTKMRDCVQSIANCLDLPIINLNAEMAFALLDVPNRQRQLKAHKVVSEIIDSRPEEIALLNHTDILFSPSLRLDALALLRGLSRNKTIIATWLGELKGDKLQHAEEWHPEYQCHAIENIKIIVVDQAGY